MPSSPMVKRVESKEELQQREAVGVIRASRFVRRYAQSHRPITADAICEIQKHIFRRAWPEIAGVYRTENMKIRESKHRPPHHSWVPGLMRAFDKTLREEVKRLEGDEGKILHIRPNDREGQEAIDRVLRLAAWVHHRITFIHPFGEGNGRTARLAANLILQRYGLTGISVRIEKENKNRYRRALAQIDQEQDFEPLLDLMAEGLVERYRGVAMKYYEYGKSTQWRRKKR